MYVCLCKGITDSQIRQAVDGGAESLREVRQELGVATGCGRCASLARDVIRETLGQNGTLKQNGGLENGTPKTGTYYEVA